MEINAVAVRDAAEKKQSKVSVKDSAKVATGDSIRRSKNPETVTVTAERPLSAASDKSFRDSDFVLRPRNSAQDMLRLVPGLVLAQHAGGGKAEQIFLRGFDADHGTDVNISVDDVPVNMLSHGHGQGYADLHFIIPETIQEVDVVKGPYDTRYGDLATAGVVAFQTKDSLKNNLLKLEGGSFDEYRALALIKGPESQTIQSYFGTDLFYTRGPFDVPQDFHRSESLCENNEPRSAMTQSFPRASFLLVPPGMPTDKYRSAPLPMASSTVLVPSIRPKAARLRAPRPTSRTPPAANRH